MATTQALGTKELVKYRVEEGVAIFELDDPPANTYTYEMMQQLDGAILKARMDENVHVILIRGAGEKFFSAGASIPMLTKADPTFKYYFCLHANETLSRLEQTPKLVIAALNGHTVGGGRQDLQFRGSARDGIDSLYLRPRELLGRRDGLRAAILPAQQSFARRWTYQALRCDRIGSWFRRGAWNRKGIAAIALHQ